MGVQRLRVYRKVWVEEVVHQMPDHLPERVVGLILLVDTVVFIISERPPAQHSKSPHPCACMPASASSNSASSRLHPPQVSVFLLEVVPALPSKKGVGDFLNLTLLSRPFTEI